MINSKVKIISIGYSVPENSFTQEEIFAVLGYPQRFWRVFKESGIEKRHLWVPPGEAKEASWQQQQEAYRDGAVKLSLQAIDECLDGRSAGDIACVVYGSCTGFTPGPTVAHYLAKPFDNTELFARIKSVLMKASKGMAVDPLTKLPGKHQIYEETRKRLERRGKFFAFVYVDIGNLRLINYRYGIDRGDSLITSLADILRDVVVGDEEFLGYMGEDDFVILSVPLRVNQIFPTVTARFDEALRDICPEMEEKGDPGEGSTIKIDMAVVTNEKKQFGDPLQVKNAALEVLKVARSHSGHYCANLKDFPV